MKSLYHKETANEFILRLNKLTNQSHALWGKMDVAQMLTHCQKPLEIASGALVPKTSRIVKVLFGKSAKKQLINDPEFKKNLPTFAEAKIVDKREFENERTKLIHLVENFQAKGVAGLTKAEHPFFGKMSENDWDILMVKHLNHHLQQFGV